MIVGYVKNGHYEEAVEIFSMMKFGGVRLGSSTTSDVIPICVHLVALKWGKETHCYLI
jgi:pentatricopeptide repeat protein